MAMAFKNCIPQKKNFLNCMFGSGNNGIGGRGRDAFAYALAVAVGLADLSFFSTCMRFASRCEASSLVRFLSFSRVLFSLALRASLSLRSFSLRRALDSNSCQSPSMLESL